MCVNLQPSQGAEKMLITTSTPSPSPLPPSSTPHLPFGRGGLVLSNCRASRTVFKEECVVWSLFSLQVLGLLSDCSVDL